METGRVPRLPGQHVKGPTTSSEVELMETLWRHRTNLGHGPTTSSEVELMETERPLFASPL